MDARDEFFTALDPACDFGAPMWVRFVIAMNLAPRATFALEGHGGSPQRRVSGESPGQNDRSGTPDGAVSGSCLESCSSQAVNSTPRCA